MGSEFNVNIKKSRFTGIRSFSKGGVIYAGPEAKQGLPIPPIENTSASISEFTITDSIFYDFIDLLAIGLVAWTINLDININESSKHSQMFLGSKKWQ